MQSLLWELKSMEMIYQLGWFCFFKRPLAAKYQTAADRLLKRRTFWSCKGHWNASLHLDIYRNLHHRTTTAWHLCGAKTISDVVGVTHHRYDLSQCNIQPEILRITLINTSLKSFRTIRKHWVTVGKQLLPSLPVLTSMTWSITCSVAAQGNVSSATCKLQFAVWHHFPFGSFSHFYQTKTNHSCNPCVGMHEPCRTPKFICNSATIYNLLIAEWFYSAHFK